METNRTDFLFGLVTRNATGKYADKDVSAKSSGFADLLVGAMSQRTDGLVAEQVKAAASMTTASLRSGRGLPAGRFDAGRNDDRSAPVAPHDRRIDRDRTAAPKNDEAPAKTSQLQEDHTGNPIHTDRKHEASAKHECDDQKIDEVAEGDPLDASSQVDAATETDTSDDTNDTGLGAEGGETDTGSKKDGETDQDSDPQMGLALVTNAAPVEDTVVTTEIGIGVVPQAAPAAADTETAPSADIAAAAALAATASLPEIADVDSGDQALTPEFALGTPASQNDTAKTAKPAVTFAAAAALATAGDLDATDAESQKVALTVDNERQLEDPDNLFRRNGSGGRKAASGGQGTTAAANAGMHPGTQAEAATTPDLHAAVTQAAAGSSVGSTTMSSVAPVGFDSGLGTATGLPGWNLHLGQGGAIRRGDFVASLRQHLQNLPVHDQVALSIQRSLRDGNGSITLQLSPTELGRIHLKLNIDEENNVQASVTVERPATLELLQRDMKALERALQEAGLKAGPGDLSFSLQGGDTEAFARDFGSGNGSGSGGGGLASDNGVEDLPTGAMAPVIATGDGWVDVQV